MFGIGKRWVAIGALLVTGLLGGAACRPAAAQQNPLTCTPVLVSQPAQLTFTIPPGGSPVLHQTMSLVNKAAGVLNWVIGENAPWIKLQSASGTSDMTGAVVDVAVDSTG